MISLLITLLSFSLPWGNLLRFEIFPNIFFRLLDLLAVILICLIALQKGLGYFHLFITRYRPVLLFGLLLVVSNLLPSQYDTTLGSLFYLARTLSYLLLIPYFFERLYPKSLPLTAIIRLSLVIVLTTGLVQYWLYPDLRNLFYLGYDPHAYRMFGFYFDPNVFGILLVWTIFFCLKYPHPTNRLLIPLTVISLFLTYSRISYLAFIIAMSYYLIVQKKIWLLTLFGMGFIIILLLLPKHFGEGTNLLRTNSILGKVATLKLVKETLDHNSWAAGIGFNNVNQIKISPDSNLPDNSQYGMDSSFLTVLTTTGLLGVFGYLWLIGSFLRPKDWFARTLTLTFFAHSLSVNSFFTPGILFYYLLLISLTVKAKATQRS